MLKLDTHAYSATILRKILTVAGETKGFERASSVLEVVGEFYISGRHIDTLACEIGQEMQQQRDEDTDSYLHHRREELSGPVPQAAAVAVDGGRLMTREADQGPGVHNQGWKEDKVGCILHLEGGTFAEDPHPEPPACFLDAPYVDKMVREIQAHHGKREEGELPQLEELRFNLAPASTAAELPSSLLEPEDKLPWPPKRKGRTCVATMANSEAFGKMMAAEAYRQKVFAAERAAFLGDGSHWIWTIHRKWFTELIPIADFVHPLTYLYVSATVLADSVSERWQQYVDWMAKCWQGRCTEVIAELESRMQALGPFPGPRPPPATDPREILERTITYLQNNSSRMNYPTYRCQGLPVTSSAVESLIKEFNYRVKGTEKFWDRPDGAEAILQIRAAVLSDNDRLWKHIANRPGSPFRRYRKKETAQAA